MAFATRSAARVIGLKIASQILQRSLPSASRRVPVTGTSSTSLFSYSKRKSTGIQQATYIQAWKYINRLGYLYDRALYCCRPRGGRGEPVS